MAGLILFISYVCGTSGGGQLLAVDGTIYSSSALLSENRMSKDSKESKDGSSGKEERTSKVGQQTRMNRGDESESFSARSIIL